MQDFTVLVKHFPKVTVRGLFRNNIKGVLLQESKIFTSSGEFTLLYTFTDVPVHVSPLQVYHIIILWESFSEY